MSKNWFERNPKKTVGCLLVVALIAITSGAEKILAYRNHGAGFNFNLPNRAIRLREYRPSMVEYLFPGKEEKFYDTLDLKRYTLKIDQSGFIIPSAKYPHPDISLVFLGASTTECRFVDEEKRFPYLTGVLLEKDLGIKVNSYNAGRSGNHTLHSLDVFLNKIAPLKPQIVVMMHNINDLAILLYEKSYWNENSSRSVIFDVNDEIVSNFTKIIRDRYIPNLAAAMHRLEKRIRSLRKSEEKSNQGDEFAGVREKQLQIDRAEMTRQFEMNLQSFIYLCKARNITPVLMTMASRFKEIPDKIIADAVQDAGLDYREFKGLFDLFNDSIRKKAAENDVLLIDLAKEIPPEKEYLYDVVHHNNAGSVKAAEIISNRLQPLVAQMVKAKEPSAKAVPPR